MGLGFHFCLWDVPAVLVFILFLFYSIKKYKTQKKQEKMLLNKIEELQSK